MNPELVDAVAGVGGRLGGSILGLPQTEALAAGRSLIDAGARIHVDLIDRGYPMRRGVSASIVAALPESWLPSVELHYMVADTPTIEPRPGVGRVIVHRSPGRRDAVPLDVRRTARLWVSIEPQDWNTYALDELLDELQPEGALMMLVAPATANQAAELRRIRSPAWAHLRAKLPLGVDGGVVASIVPTLAHAGIEYFVCGRDLFPREPSG